MGPVCVAYGCTAPAAKVTHQPSLAEGHDKAHTCITFGVQTHGGSHSSVAYKQAVEHAESRKSVSSQQLVHTTATRAQRNQGIVGAHQHM